MFNLEVLEYCRAFSTPIKISHNCKDLVFYSSSFSLFVSPWGSTVKQATKKEKKRRDYHLIQNVRVEDLICGILHLLSHIPAEPVAFSFTSTTCLPNRKHFLLLSVMNVKLSSYCTKRILVSQDQKSVLLEGLGVISAT